MEPATEDALHEAPESQTQKGLAAANSADDILAVSKDTAVDRVNLSPVLPR
jgi:hypothetical protein